MRTDESRTGSCRAAKNRLIVESSSDPQSRINLVENPSKSASRYRGIRQKLDRTWQLLQTFPLSQVFDRISKRLAAKVGWRSYPNVECAAVRTTDRFAGLLTLPEDLSHEFSGEVSLLNQNHFVGKPVDWRMSHANSNTQPSHLWMFQLHYHEWTLRFQPKVAINLIDDWIGSNSVRDPKVHHDAWHPYCISRRIPVWIRIFSNAPELTTPKHLASLTDQVEFLSRNLETDLRGNHVLENLYAVALASCYFEGSIADQFFDRIESRLATELEFQFLESGEHYERSPMYHCVVTANLIRLAIGSAEIRHPLADLVTPYAIRAWRFLESILCPDGEIPLLSDSCFAEAPSIETIRTELEMLQELIGNEKFDKPLPPAHHELSQSASMVGDYWIHRSPEHQLLLDFGPLAAKGLPGHAHCDLFNLVGSLGESRILVDSGNGSYDLDGLRRYCRSSSAHNVMTFNRLDHAEVWSKFRMGFRGRPIRQTTGSQNEFDWIQVSHDAYRRLGLQSMSRWCAAHRQHAIWVCIDSIPQPPKILNSDDRMVGYLHFAPEVSLEIQSSKVIIELENKQWILSFHQCEQIQIADSVVCQEFGKPVSNLSIVYSSTAPPTSRADWWTGWCLSPFEHEIQLERPTEPELFLRLLMDQQVTNFRKIQL